MTDLIKGFLLGASATSIILLVLFLRFERNLWPFSEQRSVVFVEKQDDGIYMSLATLNGRAYGHVTMDKTAALRVVNDINNALREEGAGRDASGIKTWAVPSGVTHVEIMTWKRGGGDEMATDIHIGKGGDGGKP